jgi:hypothetical protein
MKDFVLYVVSAFMLIILLLGIIGAYFGFRLLLYVRKNYPDKVLKYIFYPIGLGALEKELSSKDSYFNELNEKVKNVQKLIMVAVGCIVFLALMLLIIAIVFGRSN